MLRVLIADDHPIFRHGLRSLIEEKGDMEVVAEAQDGASAMRQIEYLGPDVAVLDLAMPVADGLAVAAWIGENAPAVAAVILTMYDDRAYLERALELGVRGYLLKDDAHDELVRCVEQVAKGERYISPNIGRDRKLVLPDLDRASALIAQLTPGQRQVLRLLTDDKTSKDIAQELGLSYRTVQNHRAHIVETLGLGGHNALLAFANRYRDQL